MYRAMKIILCSALVLTAVVMPVGNAGPAMANGSRLILFWDGDTIPSGWTCISASAGDPFYNRFPRGAATYGGQGGSDTHIHGAGSISTGIAIPFSGSPRWGEDVPLFSHHHDISHSSMSAESNFPECRSLKVISYDTGIPALLPAGTIALFSGTLPAGWERYAAQDGRMVLGKATVVTGGSNQHRHSDVNIVLTSAKGDNKVSGKLKPNVPVAPMSHDHSIDDISYLSWEQNVPPYASVIMAKANTETTIPAGMLGLFDNSPPATWNIQSNQQGHFYHRFLQGSLTYGEVGGASSHSHQNSSGETKLNTPIPKLVWVVPVYLFSMVTHRHSYTVKWTEAINIPPYTDVIIAAYEPGIPSLETETPSLVTESSATLNGDITDIGDTRIIERGFEWDADGVTPFTNSWTETGTFGLGAFSHLVDSLARGTLYYARSKAMNEATSTWGYGSVASFLTKPAAPTGLAITAGDQQLSLTWTKGEAAAKTLVRSSTITYPETIADGVQVYFDTGSNTVNTGLANGTTYYFSAWSEVTTATLQQFSSYTATIMGIPHDAPDVTTDTVTAITGTTAVLNANITNVYGEDVVERGFDWDTNSAETYANSWTENGTFQAGPYTHTLTGLTKGQIYYLRGKARHNRPVWGYGQEKYFITRPDPPFAFTATAAIGRVNLAWSKGDGAFCTYIERSTTSYPTNPGDGTPIYSGTDSAFSDDTEIWPQTHYYYSAWSVAEGGGEIQLSTDKAESSAFVTTAPSVTTITIVALFLLLSMAAARQLLSAKRHQKR